MRLATALRACVPALACAGLTLISAPAARAGSIGTADDSGSTMFTVSGTVGPTDALGDIYLVYYATCSGPGCTTSPITSEHLVTSGPVFGTVPATAVTLPGYITSGYGTILAIHEPLEEFLGATDDTGNVSVLLNPTATAADTGKAFSAAFGGANESAIATDLTTGTNLGDLLTFLENNQSQFISFTNATVGATGGVLNFTNGTAGGSLSLSVTSTPGVTGVPEPSTMILLGAGLAGVGFLRRRFSRAR